MPLRSESPPASSPAVSIILCTRNRAEGLRRTLASLDRCTRPAGRAIELLLVDNGSTDDTAAVIRSTRLHQMEVVPLREPQPGKANALNTALRHARGNYLFFTDDDVIVAPDWIEAMVAFLETENFDAATGRISLAPRLVRPWMTPQHRWWLACSEDAEPYQGNRELIGANMACKRQVLERVPGFDPELGPGALGLAEDTLFGWQLIEAGFRIGYASDARVTHEPDPSRLNRAQWLNEARKHGCSEAYLFRHWTHIPVRQPRLKQGWYRLKLVLRRLLQPQGAMDAEGCVPWEISYVFNLALCAQFLREEVRPRNYPLRGLARQAARSSLAPA